MIRCLSSSLVLHCPRCDETFTSNSQLQNHIEKEFETTFPTMSLASEGTLSDIHDTCKQCGKHELDVANHELRVHEFGETFDLYP